MKLSIRSKRACHFHDPYGLTYLARWVEGLPATLKQLFGKINGKIELKGYLELGFPKAPGSVELTVIKSV